MNFRLSRLILTAKIMRKKNFKIQMLVGNRLKIRVGASSQISMTLDKNLFDVTTILNKADSSNKSPENISFYSNTKQVSKYFFKHEF